MLHVWQDEIDALHDELRQVRATALKVERDLIIQIALLHQKISASEEREDQVRQENENLLQDVLNAEQNAAAIQRRLDECIRERDHWRELNAKHVREIDAFHGWLDDYIYPSLGAAKKIVEGLQEAKDAFNSVGVEYPWH